MPGIRRLWGRERTVYTFLTITLLILSWLLITVIIATSCAAISEWWKSR